jgi:DNA-binding MarR family transcriptional regulator/GNAT superfamily N-acetyltransferase
LLFRIAVDDDNGIVDTVNEMTSPTDEIRAFNRFYTRAIGMLGSGLHATTWSLAEARVLYELAQRPATDVTDLKRTLELDAGYLSRLLARLERTGVVAREPSETDRRRQVARLTDDGRAAFAELRDHATAEAQQLLDRLDPAGRESLVGAMGTIRAVLGDERRTRIVTLRDGRPGDLGWVVEAHGRLYADEYGWDARFEALVARVCADHLETAQPGRDAAWIAELDGERVGSVLCVRVDDTTAKLRLLLVEPRARGLGVGARLVDECIAFARRAGYRELVLWTNDVLASARRIYEAAGFELVASGPHASFGKPLVGQTWRLAL